MVHETPASVVLDNVAANVLLSTGVVMADDTGVVKAASFAIPLSEYTIMYSKALASKRFCPPRYHAVATMMEKRCECLDGWVPLLSASFIEALASAALIILPQQPESIALRLGLRSAFPGLGDRDSSLLAIAILTSSSTLVCTGALSPAYVATAGRLGLEIMELRHADCPAVKANQGPEPGQ